MAESIEIRLKRPIMYKNLFSIRLGQVYIYIPNQK